MKKLILFLAIICVSYTSKCQSNYNQPVAPPDTSNQYDLTGLDSLADFIGGMPAWSEFVRKNFQYSPPYITDAPVGTYVVEIKFIIDKDGGISHIEKISSNGWFVDECMRLLSICPNWKPAIRKGTPVESPHIQTFTFLVEHEW
jgi:hypothetical protein